MGPVRNTAPIFRKLLDISSKPVALFVHLDEHIMNIIWGNVFIVKLMGTGNISFDRYYADVSLLWYIIL